MQFLYPGFLLALLAVSIPILIHLFNFKRYKKVYFSNIRFLKDIEEETKSRSRLKHLLILLSRILLVSFLVLAFAQPYIPLSENSMKEGKKEVAIFIDNSFSMNQVGEYGQLFNVARQYAYQIIKSYPSSTQFKLVTQDGGNQRLYSQETALSKVGELKESSASKPLDQVWDELTRNDNSENRQLECFVLSDFQSDADKLDFEPDSNTNLHLIPLSGNMQGNVSIDSVWFNNPVRKSQVPEELFVKISNYSPEALSSFPVKLMINGSQKSIANVNIDANSSEVFSFSYSINQGGWVKGSIEIDDYPIVFDNQLYFAYQVHETNPVVVLNDKDSSKPLGALFGQDENFLLSQENVNQFNNNNLINNDIVVLNSIKGLNSSLSNELLQWVNNGGHLVVFPSSNNQDVNSMLQKIGAAQFGVLDTQGSRISQVEYDHPLYYNVFEKVNTETSLPKVFQSYPITGGSLGKSVVLNQVNGAPFLIEQKYGEGKVYQFASNLDAQASDFVKHSLFVVTLYQIGISNTSNQSLYNTLGKQGYFVAQNIKNDLDLIELEGNEYRFVPERRNRGKQTEFWYHEQLKEAGFYQLIQSNQELAWYALNYNQTESSNQFIGAQTLEEMAESNPSVFYHEEGFDEIGNTLEAIMFGKQLWQYMILMGLLMILFEILLIKFWKE